MAKAKKVTLHRGADEFKITLAPGDVVVSVTKNGKPEDASQFEIGLSHEEWMQISAAT